MRLVISSVSGATVSWRSLRTIQQRHLGQLAVGHFGEQAVSGALWPHARWVAIQPAPAQSRGQAAGWCTSIFFALFQHHFLAFTHGLLAHLQLSCATSRFSRWDSIKASMPAPDALGQPHPGKPKHHSRPGHTQHNGNQTRTRKAQPFDAQRTQPSSPWHHHYGLAAGSPGGTSASIPAWCWHTSTSPARPRRPGDALAWRLRLPHSQPLSSCHRASDGQQSQPTGAPPPPNTTRQKIRSRKVTHVCNPSAQPAGPVEATAPPP